MSIKQRFCSECGAQLKENDHFCPECGTKVMDEDENDGRKNSSKKVPTSPALSKEKSKNDFKPEKHSTPLSKPIEKIKQQDKISSKHDSYSNKVLWLTLGMLFLVLIVTVVYMQVDKQNQITRTKALQLPSSDKVQSNKKFTNGNGQITLLGETYTSSSTITNKWFIPSQAICKKNGGEISSNGICISRWLDAQRICKENKSSLATINELERLVETCGGRINKDNKDNSSYHECYKEKGFVVDLDYWSLSLTEITHIPKLLNISSGAVYSGSQNSLHTVICHNK